MPNPYTNMYMPNGFDQNQQGLMPVFQNIGQQQANQNAALQEQNVQVQQAGMTQKQGGPNQLALAMALRKTPNEQLIDKYGANNVYLPNGNGAQAPAYPTGMDY
jgi:hypothetical protein